MFYLGNRKGTQKFLRKIAAPRQVYSMKRSSFQAFCSNNTFFWKCLRLEIERTLLMSEIF